MILEEYNAIVLKYVSKYGKKFQDYKEYYEKNINNIDVVQVRNLVHDYKIDVKNFLFELIDEFDEIKKYKFVVFLNGSFSRNTNTILIFFMIISILMK